MFGPGPAIPWPIHQSPDFVYLSICCDRNPVRNKVVIIAGPVGCLITFEVVLILLSDRAEPVTSLDNWTNEVKGSNCNLKFTNFGFKILWFTYLFIVYEVFPCLLFFFFRELIISRNLVYFNSIKYIKYPF